MISGDGAKLNGDPAGKRKRTRKVRSYPVHPLRDALSVAQTIQEANSGMPFDRLALAGKLSTTPSSSGFTMRLNSSSRYGLTRGGYRDALISLTEIGRAVVTPVSEEERRATLVECVLRPQVFRDFYESLEGRKLPERAFAKNILERDHHIDADLSEECLDVILDNGQFVGLLREVSGSLWVGVKSVRREIERSAPSGDYGPAQATEPAGVRPSPEPPPSSGQRQAPEPRVFIGHFGCAPVAARIESLLSDFGIEHAAVDVGGRSSGLLSPEISEAMDRCTAAVIVADDPVASEGVPDAQAAIGFMAGAAAAKYGPRLLVVVSGGRRAPQLWVPSIVLRSGAENGAAESLRLLGSLAEAGVIRVSA